MRLCCLLLFPQRYDVAAKSQLKKIVKIFQRDMRKVEESAKKEVN